MKVMIIFNNILRVIGIISIILPLILVFIFMQPTYTLIQNEATNYDINYVFLIILEIMNIIFTMLLFIKKENIKKWICILFCIYIIISVMIPIYHIKDTRTPTGFNSHLMGLAVVDVYNDMYGIDISFIINMFK